MTDEQIPQESVGDWMRRKARESETEWNSFVDTLGEDHKKILQKMDSQFLYDSVSTITTLLGAALIYHSEFQQIADQNAALDANNIGGGTEEMSRIGRVLLFGHPDDIEPEGVYGDYINSDLEFSEPDEKGNVTMITPEDTEELKASREAYQEKVRQASTVYQEALHAAGKYIPFLWH